MAKKHRVKRQKYVEYLLRVERERDAYLAKRNRKRDRGERNADDQLSGVTGDITAGDRKRVRKETIGEERTASPLLPKEEEKSSIDSVKSEKADETTAGALLPATNKIIKRIKRRY